MANYRVDPAELGPVARQAIVAELERRKGLRFRDPQRQEAFLRGVARAVGRFRITSSARPTDTSLMQSQVGNLADYAARLEHAFRSLPPDTQDVFVDLVHFRTAGELPYRARLGALDFIRGFAAAATELAAEHKRARGEHDPIGGPRRMLCYQLSATWHQAFGVQPAAGGAFGEVTATVLDQIGTAPIGREALAAILAGR